MTTCKRVSTRVRNRKLDRLVAHARMKKIGLKHVNKHDYNEYITPTTGMRVQQRLDSYFAGHWRKFAGELVKM